MIVDKQVNVWYNNTIGNKGVVSRYFSILLNKESEAIIMTKCSSRMKALLLVLAMVLSLFCVSIGTAHPRFTDVPDSFWASKEIAWAVDKGVVNGTSATTFSPNDKTLRGQMTAIIVSNGK